MDLETSGVAGIRMFKTSWWQHVPVTLTTAVLRRVLARLGGALLRLHIDHHWSALNDRTAHTVGKFCPQLEELKVLKHEPHSHNKFARQSCTMSATCYIRRQ